MPCPTCGQNIVNLELEEARRELTEARAALEEQIVLWALAGSILDELDKANLVPFMRLHNPIGAIRAALANTETAGDRAEDCPNCLARPCMCAVPNEVLRAAIADLEGK